MFETCEQHPPHVCIVFSYPYVLCSVVLCRAYGCLFPHCLKTVCSFPPARTHAYTKAHECIQTHAHIWCGERQQIQPYTTRESFKQFLLSSRNSNDEDYRPKQFIVSLGISLIVKRKYQIYAESYLNSAILIQQNIFRLIFLFFFDSYN